MFVSSVCMWGCSCKCSKKISFYLNCYQEDKLVQYIVSYKHEHEFVQTRGTQMRLKIILFSLKRRDNNMAWCIPHHPGFISACTLIWGLFQRLWHSLTCCDWDISTYIEFRFDTANSMSVEVTFCQSVWWENIDNELNWRSSYLQIQDNWRCFSQF